MEKDLLTINDHSRRQSQANKVVNLGLFVNAILAITKLSAGIMGHSKALLADGINSISDVVYFIVVKILVTLSGKPADDEHPYGHHQFESIAALVIGAFVITTGIAIFWDSINSAFDILVGTSDNKPIRLFTLFIALATIITKILLMLNALSVSKKTGNLAVTALASDHRNDIFASTGAAVGISFGLFGIPLFDPLAGAVVAVIVVKTGVDILRESAAELMDTMPNNEIDNQIRTMISRFEQVKSIETVHAHRFGPYFMANITIGIDGNLSVSEGDKIADEVEEYLCAEIETLRRVYIHYHPTTLLKE